MSAEERKAARKALDQAISEVWDGAIHSFRMKISGIHAPAYGGQDGGRKMHIERDGFTVIRISEPMKKDVVESRRGNGHPAVFPVRLVREIIRLLSPPGGKIMDPYIGGGSTMIAALKEVRGCVGIDISQQYCDMAFERLISESENG